MNPERVVFVGGPLDGQTKTYFEGLGLIQIPVSVDEQPETYHKYGQADLVQPGADAFNAAGDRRYVYLGEGEAPVG